MGELDGFIATVMGRIASKEGVEFDVSAVVVLLEASTSHVIASAIAPSLSSYALDPIDEAGGMFGPHVVGVPPISQTQPVEAAPPSPPVSEPSTPL